jgi:transposase
MKRIHPLTDEEFKDLDRNYKNGEKHHFRIRCRAILLSNEGQSVPKIAKLLGKQADTIYSWLGRYESFGVGGLENVKGQGVKAKLDSLGPAQVATLEKTVGDEPQNLNKAGALLSLEFGFSVTKRMLIRFLKKTKI